MFRRYQPAPIINYIVREPFKLPDLTKLRRYENWEYGYPEDRPLSDSQRTVPPETVAKMHAKMELAFKAMRREYV